MATTIVRHSVADYDTWKAGYDEAASLRTDNGVRSARVFRDPQDPSIVCVTHEFDSVDAAAAFVSLPELAEAMQRLGVTGAPRIEIYDEVS